MDQASRRWGCMEMKSEVGVCGEEEVGVGVRAQMREWRVLGFLREWRRGNGGVRVRSNFCLMMGVILSFHTNLKCELGPSSFMVLLKV